MRKVQEGFTLIELLIVVAIIGILAAIAIPSYQKYVKKAKFSEVVSATSPFKLAVEACLHEQGGLVSCVTPTSNGIPSDAVSNGKFVESVATSSGGGGVLVTGTGTAAVDSVNIILDGAPGTGSNLINWTKSTSSTCIAAGYC